MGMRGRDGDEYILESSPRDLQFGAIEAWSTPPATLLDPGDLEVLWVLGFQEVLCEAGDPAPQADVAGEIRTPPRPAGVPGVMDGWMVEARRCLPPDEWLPRHIAEQRRHCG